MKKLIYLQSFLVIALLFTASCKKGDVGPQGEQGATGADGVKGAKGDQGPTGTANVIYSDWIYSTNFRDTLSDNSAVRAADIKAPKLTAALLNNASVMVYLNFGGGVYALPYTSYAGGKLNTISYWPRVGKIIITRFTADNSRSIALSSLIQYRYVIIPGAVKAITSKNIDLSNYVAVKKFYNIPD
ncbi:MAG: collagen-like protein [Sphingobacteriaceae bacterium]|nr:MAG: collagen-like protein [Sphingobacteriaceae bacterium]